MKKILVKSCCILITIAISVLLFTGCNNKIDVHRKQFLGSFDTVIGFVMHTDSKNDFDDAYEYAKERFEQLHQYFDIYNEYTDINNIKTINDNAGVKPIEVSDEILDLIEISIEWYDKTNAKFNIAFGPVLKIWHDFRQIAQGEDSNAPIPTIEELKEASFHTSIELVILDRENGTVYLEDSDMRLDVGAIGKGYAAQLVTDELIELGYDNFAINAGGNVVVKGSPIARESDLWIIGIQDPDKDFKEDPGDGIINRVSVKDTSVVTSGWYQRYYISDGEIYHHVIDPETLFPQNYFKAVTIIHPDSAISDILSTVLMLMTYEEGFEYIKSIPNAAAFWVLDDGSIKVTDGLEEILTEKINGEIDDKAD